MEAADTMTKKMMPTAEVLKSTKKFATVASTLAKISRPSKPNMNNEDRLLDFSK